ncbi:MAG TPA: Yip1 family protein [Rhabdochlamydiaceae bacterium]|jgi:hypothetical protein
MASRKVEGNPWLSIWVRPRETIRTIIETNPTYGFFLLCVLYGFPMTMSFAQNMSFGAAFPAWSIFLAGLIISPFLGYVGICVSTWLLKVAGKWIGGEGSFTTIRSAVAWSNVPNAVTLITWFVLFGFFGARIFCRGFSESNFMGYESGVVFLVFLVQSIVSIWGFILLLKTLGEVQGFSAWRALLNVLIPFVIIVALAWLVGWAIWGTNSIIK